MWILIRMWLRIPTQKTRKNKTLPISSWLHTNKVEIFQPYLMKVKTENYKPTGKLKKDWSNSQMSFVHYRSPNFYIRHWIRIIDFIYSPGLAKYIKYNTEERNKAKTEIEKCFYKLRNNSFYRRTIVYEIKMNLLKFVPLIRKAINLQNQNMLAFVYQNHQNC